MKVERICPTEETRGASAQREQKKKKKKKGKKRPEPAFYLQNRSSVVETIGGMVRSTREGSTRS